VAATSDKVAKNFSLLKLKIRKEAEAILKSKKKGTLLFTAIFLIT